MNRWDGYSGYNNALCHGGMSGRLISEISENAEKRRNRRKNEEAERNARYNDALSRGKDRLNGKRVRQQQHDDNVDKARSDAYDIMENNFRTYKRDYQRGNVRGNFQDYAVNRCKADLVKKGYSKSVIKELYQDWDYVYMQAEMRDTVRRQDENGYKVEVIHY